MKRNVMIELFAILVCCVGANFRCKPEQIHWNNTEGKQYKCLDCPDCPAGSQPSVACGSSVKYGTPVHCVSCELGKTFSDKYDKAQCKACKICSKGKAVQKNCTLSTNTKCDKKCGNGFYTVHLISSCLPCKQCCDDGKDELATECMNNKEKCKVRYTKCTHVHTMSSKPPDHVDNISVTLPTTQTVPLESETTTIPVDEQENLVSEKFSTSTTPTWPVHNEALNVEAVESGKQDGISIVVILLMIVLAMCLVMSVFLISKKLPARGLGMLRSSREQNSNNGGNNIAPRNSPPQSNWSASYTSGQDSVSSALNRPESSQPNDSESPQSSESVSPPLNRPESSQSNRPESTEFSGCPRPQTGSVSPKPDGCTLPQSNCAASAQSSHSAQQQDKSDLGDLTLEQLEENYLPTFDWMCKQLDIRKRRGHRWDFESLAFQFKDISQTVRDSLKNEFQNDRGSPSDVLMGHIKTKYPNLPLRDLVGSLQNIGRNDIAKGLINAIQGSKS